MTPAEVSALIAVIGAYDRTAIPTDDLSREAKVHAWHAALDPDMPLVEARDLVVDHYGKSDDPVSCGVLNYRWRRSREPLGLPPGIVGVPDPPNATYLAAKAQLRRVAG